MANLQNNRLNVTATAEQMTAVKTALQTINTNLPFLVGLTDAERSWMLITRLLQKMLLILRTIILL